MTPNPWNCTSCATPISRGDSYWIRMESGEGESHCARCAGAKKKSPDRIRYGALISVLEDAVQQASKGKGSERHDSNGDAFEDQKIVQIGEWMGTNHFEVGQAVKKSIESTRLPPERARAELLGAINYLAAAVLCLDRGGAK